MGMTNHTKEMALSDALDHLEKQACQLVEIAAEINAVVFDPAHPDAPLHRRMEVLQALQKGHQDAFRPEVSKALEAVLRDVLTRAVEANKVTPETRDAMAGWLENANPEALVTWLENGGWEKVDSDKLRTAMDEVAGKDIFNALKTVLALRLWGGLGGILYEKITRENHLEERKPARWLRLLAAPWLQDAAEKEAERQQRAAVAAPFAIRAKAKTDAGNQWTPLPRALEGAAAMGGPFSVNLNGEIYAEEPDIAAPAVGHALRPKGWDIVPVDWLKKPAQLDLSLNLTAPPDAVREYLIETATKTAHLAQLPNMCPKLLGFMFAASPVSGRPVKGTLEELHHLLYPDWKARRQTKRELQGLGAAFVALKGLRLMETKPDGTRHPYDLFTLDYDLSCNPEATVGFMLNPWLVERMQGGAGGGYFLLNMTRWLALGIQNPRLFPLALRLAAQWDHARQGGVYHKEKLQWLEADRLAFECNTLPEGAAAYRAGKTADATGKTALSNARANLEADLDALKEAGLLGDWKKTKVYGKGFNLLPAPPADYAEACKRATQTVQKGKARKGQR